MVLGHFFINTLLMAWLRKNLSFLVLTAGAGAVALGAGMIYLPAGLIAGGTLAIAGGVISILGEDEAG